MKQNITHMLAAAVAGLAFCATQAMASNDVTGTYVKAGLGSMPYHVFYPDGYNAATDGSLPIILYLHGAGERGNNNTSQISYIINGMLNETQHGTHKAIVIAPQVSTVNQWVNWWWANGSYHNAQQPAISTSMQMAMNILAEVQGGTTKDDTNRVYVTGLSMGGYGAWDAITRFPNTFAAAMPLSGGGNVDLAPLLVDRGIWAWHGDEDATVPVSASDDMVNAIIAAGGDPLYDRIEGLGHWGWDGFYNSPEVYDWLFQQTLAPEPGSCVLVLGLSGLMLGRRRR